MPRAPVPLVCGRRGLQCSSPQLTRGEVSLRRRLFECFQLKLSSRDHRHFQVPTAAFRHREKFGRHLAAYTTVRYMQFSASRLSTTLVPHADVRSAVASCSEAFQGWIQATSTARHRPGGTPQTCVDPDLESATGSARMKIVRRSRVKAICVSVSSLPFSFSDR
ncbi:hypothetical protein SETIT_9G440800v2 [Setaria italica]|uniref:Uncharacterized protein n=1 Tax=Setaria italica TaxID=4555 RepID=A0A368SSA7_SETIT|nr:hypothetical protein SETIT_9G440800v2 [Setaria italica]